jgi:LacI family transcriptional regulator
MRDVAALAGVSVKTVSRVVNNEPSVSDDVAQRVRAAVTSLGYRHHLAASNLRRSAQRTGTVAALLQDLSNAYSASVLHAIEAVAHERDVAVVASSLDEEPDRERGLVESLVRRRVDGLVLMPATASQDYLLPDLEAGLVAVFVDRRPHGVDVDSVAVDGEQGAAVATTHLLDHGHRRVAFLGDLPRIETARARYAGYERALTERGLTLDPALVATGLRSAGDAERTVRALLDAADPPTAIFAARNSLAQGAIRALHGRGASHTTALVGFDDIDLAEVLDPPLTVVRQDVDAIGSAVAGRLFARLDGDTTASRAVDVALELVTRGSGEVRPPGRR